MAVRIPVTWEVCGIAEVEAESIEEAVKKLDAEKYDIDPPHGSEYVEGSLSLTFADPEIIATYQK